MASCMGIDVYKDTTSRLHGYGRVLLVVKSPAWMYLISSRLFSRCAETSFSRGLRATEWSYMKIPYISERLNYRITSIFRKEGIPVRVAHKSYTLRRALSHNNKERTCMRTKLCLLRNVVYQITCNNCNQHYIGSTIRFIHDRVREHLNNDNSSVKKHLSQCQNKGIEIKSIVLENDPANLRLLEAFYIRKYKPTMNSREECSEFADLLF